jgi:hypothetical protein
LEAVLVGGVTADVQLYVASWKSIDESLEVVRPMESIPHRMAKE